MTPQLIKAAPVRPINQTPHNGSDFKLKELYAMLNCSLIDIVRITPELIFVIDDEGKINGKPVNVVATLLARNYGAIFPDDYIAGDVLFCNDTDVR